MAVLNLSFKISEMLYIGHKNPDTDSICSALATAELFGGEAGMTSAELSPESAFVLNKFGFSAPQYVENLAGKEIVLVDFNQKSQGQAGIEEANIQGIIDHHATGADIAFNSQPILIRIEPIGSTCSVITKMAEEMELEISPKLAGLLLAGIVSDTLALRSPTTTDDDREIAQYLQELSGVKDLTALLKEMLKAKSDLSKKNAIEILNLDYKIFDYNQKVGIGVAETVTPEDLIIRKDELLAGLREMKAKDHLAYIYFVIVDVLNEHSEMLILGQDELALAQKAFNGKVKNDFMDLGNRISRKKQIAPEIQSQL